MKNPIGDIKIFIAKVISEQYAIEYDECINAEFKINTKIDTKFGDLSCNIAFLVAKRTGQSQRDVAMWLCTTLLQSHYNEIIEKVEVAGAGFVNITFTTISWVNVIALFLRDPKVFFSALYTKQKKRYLLEFVSANPTGPLHLGHGRGAVIGDVLARIFEFFGHTVSKEFYINDAGNQIFLLGQSFKARCLQYNGHVVELPEKGYAGDYLIDLAAECVADVGKEIEIKDDIFFQDYAKKNLLALIESDLKRYGVIFDTWYSEKMLHVNGSVDEVLQLLSNKELVYQADGAWWFKSTLFGDDKDRVVKKANGELTYIAADIAYHKNKFDRNYDVLIDILGHDHHGYVRRLKATMEALGYNAHCLHVILYQLVNIKNGEEAVRMSKRAGMFTKLSEVIDAVGVDVARFFYLNRKYDSALDFDLALAVKTTDENPVYYIQYAYVRLFSLLRKAAAELLVTIENDDWMQDALKDGVEYISIDDIALIKKIISLLDVLCTIAENYQTHMLAYYASELSAAIHSYYTVNKIIDHNEKKRSLWRLILIDSAHKTLGLVLELLGLSKPEKM